MATAGNERYPATWEALLAAINPPRRTPEELYELALDEVTAAWEAREITDEEADELLKELFSAKIRYEMSKMIDFAFSPDIGRRSADAPRRRFRLL